MTTKVFHAATIDLLLLQSRGRRRRIWRRFRQPRRFVLSAVACVLAVAWLGNAAITVWLREPASLETLRALLSLGLATYALWHITKAAFFRPESPFDWTPAERDLLAPMPLLPRDLVAYQLASVTMTTVLKAGLFTILLLPDLRCLPLGFLGVLLAMLALEMLRMTIEIATWGMSRAAFITYRAAVVVGLTIGGLAVGTTIARANVFTQVNVGDGLLKRLLAILVDLDASIFSYVSAPFTPFLELIVAHSITTFNVAIAAAAIASLIGCGAAVIGFYGATTRSVARRERHDYRATREVVAIGRQERTRCASRQRIPYWGGTGALVWRQLVGARRQWGSLLTSMIAPAFAASVPCYVVADANTAILATAAALTFYTFLLLPTAIRCDFRRDLDRLAILKGFPITPAAAVIGQVLAPVLIATLFQGVVLAAAVAARSLPLHQFVVAMLIMAPLNMLVFSLENLIYLLYPYRMQQEGLEIFFRTMLTFTGKGLLFAGGLVVIAAWGFTAAALAHAVSNWTGSDLNAYAVFTVGMVAGPSFLAGLVLCALSRTYRNMDPIEDVPR